MPNYDCSWQMSENTMSDAPRFFLPNTESDKREEGYKQIADWLQRPIPERRVYAITYEHDSDYWTATIGERLKGSRTVRVRPLRLHKERTEKLEDPAMVVAIFPGAPYLVVTDSGVSYGQRSGWENPFLAGNPISVTYFSAE